MKLKKTPMTSTELVQWLKDGCFDDRFADAFDSGEEGDIHSVFDHYTAEEIVYKAELYERRKETE
jgi:hypothetical protein